MAANLEPIVAQGLPEELDRLLVGNWTAEFASLKRDGTPVTVPLVPNAGEDGRTIDVNTGLAYPTKAERARRNPRVCLLYSEPRGSVVDDPPVVLVYGHATVHDADLQANTDRYVRATLERMPLFRKMPGFLFGQMYGYLARIWIAVTPLKILWWPGGDMSGTPRRWDAPEGTTLPVSDPPPRPPVTVHEPLVRSSDWRRDLDHAVKALRAPILTVVDGDGYPVPFRVRTASRRPGGVLLETHSTMPATPEGRACLTFHTITVKRGSMISNDNLTFLGHVTPSAEGAMFTAERRLPGISFRLDPAGLLTLTRMMLGFRKRLASEAARRGQPVPTVHLPDEHATQLGAPR